MSCTKPTLAVSTLHVSSVDVLAALEAAPYIEALSETALEEIAAEVFDRLDGLTALRLRSRMTKGRR